MAEEDPLQYLKDRIKEDVNRRSRATTQPLDNAPDTYMGASVKEMVEEQAGEDELKVSTASEPLVRKEATTERENSEAESAPDEDGTLKKPRAKKSDRSRTRQTSLVTKILSQDVSIVPDGDKGERDDEQAKVVRRHSAAGREGELKKEVAQLEDQLEEATEQLEDYDVLCERLLEGKKPSARNLAIYIGELRDAVEDAEGYKEKLRTTSSELVLIKADVDGMRRQTESAKEEIRQLSVELDATRARLAKVEDAEGKSAESEEHTRKLEELETALASRDAELERAKRELAELKELPSNLEEEAALYRQAEEDLDAMEGMLREQEDFMAQLEADMEKSLRALPPSLREAFLKEKEHMLASLDEGVDEKNEKSEDEKDSPLAAEGALSPKGSSRMERSPSPLAAEGPRSSPAEKSFAAAAAATAD